MTFPISLIITTYNRQQYLSCAIESILQQTQRHFELLIWDDGSTDASLEIAYQYASQDSRVRVVSAPHLGRGPALKKAIAATQGKYIGWVDSDDWLAPTALAETADFLNRHPPVGMVYTDYFDIDPNGNTIGYGQRCSIPYSPAKLLSFFMTFHFRLIRRSVYDAVGGIRAAFETAEDYDLCLRLSEVTEIGRIHQPLYFYRHHSQNISTQQDQKQRLRSHAAALEALSRRNSAPSLSPSLMPISVQRSNWHLRSPLLLWERGVKKGRKEVPLGKGDLGGSSLREMLNFSSVQKLTQYALPSLVAIAFSFEPAIAQSITPASDGTNTQVIQDGTQFNIQGGTLSSDGNNLFHSFQQFGLNPNEVANFLSNPQIQNILGRVIGGDASYINGLIQVSGGNSNLFLMNPAGMVFGNNAHLNVPAAFSATTATGIAFENGIFNAFGTNDYTNLTGNPTAFNFNTSQPGSIVNNGNLEVAPEQNLSLIGGTVVNVGTLKAPGGNITVTAVPGSSRVRFTPEGHLLSLELELPTDSNGNLIPITPQILPELLVGSPTNTGLTVDANNSVYTASGTQLPTNPGVAVSNGILNASSSNIGGNVHVFGQQVGLVDNAQVNVSGELGGGIALIGGDFQGKGTVPNAQTTYIGQNAEINADAITEGNGGEVIIWSDDTTRFYGNISATGGANSGDGGFVEVSGKQNLTFQGFVDTAAPNGNWGQLLLDPDFLTIVDSAAGTGDLDTNLSEDSFIASGDGVSSNTVSWGQIIAQGNVDITLQATNDITIENITGVVSGTDSLIELPLTTGTLTIESFFGSISFQDSTDTIRTQGGNLSFIAGNQLSLGNLETNGGNIFLDLFSTSSVGNLSTGVLNTSSTTGAGGNILIEAYGYYGDPITISVDNINTSSSSPSGDNGGTVEIFALAESFETSSLTESKVTINGDILTTSATGSGGDVTIEADTSSSSGDVKSSISVSGNIDTSATSGNAGNIRLDSLSEASTFGSPTAESDIKTANIIATSDIGNGGNVDLNSYAKSSSIIIGTIITGDINTSSLSGTGGNISFTSQYDPGEGSIVYSDLGQILLLEENRTFNAGTGSITFDNVELNLEGNDLTLTGDEINLDVSKSKKVYGSGNLILQPGTASQSIQLGSTDAGDPAILELSTAELALLENGFASITIGSEMGEGTITLADNLTFNDPIILRSPLGIGQINTAGFGITGNDNATITLIANESINADTISNPGRAIALQSNEVNFNAGSGSIIGGTLFIFPSSDTQNINIGNASDAGINSLDLLTSDINAIASGFTSITIGEVTNLGTITLFESVTDSGLTPFTSPVILAGGSTLVGANVNSTWELTGVDSGNLNSIFSNGFTFNSIENLTGGTANDTFQINDGFSLSGNLNAGDGNDTLDYSTYTTENVTIDLSNQVATGIDGIVSNFENFVANSSLNNTLIGENTSSDWTVSSLNSGTVNGSSFSNFQNLQGGSANDTFTLTGGTVSNINGSGGDNTLVGDNTNNTFNITGTNSGDVNGIAFTSIQNLTGGSANDTFILTGGTVSNIDGGDGSNTLESLSTENTWNIISTNTGNLNTSVSFSRIGNFTGGDFNDTFNFSEGASISGNINGAGGDLILNGNEINYEGNISGTGTLLIQPITTNQEIQIGGVDSGSNSVLTLTTAEISALQNGFSSITIGRADGSGILNLAGDVTFSDPITLRSPLNSGSIITTDSPTLTGIDNATITLFANQNITTGSIINRGRAVTITSNNGTIDTSADTINTSGITGENGGDIIMTALGNIITANLISGEIGTTNIGGEISLNSIEGQIDASAGTTISSAGTLTGGNITLLAQDSILTNNLISAAQVGNAGNVFLDPIGDIQVGYINAQGGSEGQGGNVDITAGQFFRATNSFVDQNGLETSIATAGGTSGGSIIIRHGGNGEIPFEVGDATTNGTVAAISSGEFSITPIDSFLYTYTEGNIRIVSVPEPEVPEETIPSSVSVDLLEESETAPLVFTQTVVNTPINAVVTRLEEQFTSEFTNYFGTSEPAIEGFDEGQQALQTIEQSTGIKPAIIYVSFVPVNVANSQERLLPQDTDELELVLVTSSGDAYRTRVSGVTRSQLYRTAQTLTRNVTNARNPRGYLTPAQQLYESLIAPLEEQLTLQGIDNLTFIMESGLRSLPVAALHDGNGFLVERYSVGLMPSLSLTDTRYVDIRSTEILAMGAEDFTEQPDLPAVPIELKVITEKLWPGRFFLNDGFTIENLQQARSEQPFGIVHFATHAEFNPGTPEDSFIYLSNGKISLNELRNLRLGQPQAVELFVLSACQTALGNTDAELGFAGLAVQAGVKSALGSLWLVSDQGTLGLMSTFYEQLKTAPIKAEAMRQAQLALLNGNVQIENGKLITPETQIALPPSLAQLADQDFSHPYYWSAFTLIGNPW